MQKFSITTKTDICQWTKEFIIQNLLQNGEDPNSYYSKIEDESAGVWSLINDNILHAVFLDYENPDEVTISFRSVVCKAPENNLPKFYEWCLKVYEELKIRHLSLYNNEIILNNSFIIHSVSKVRLYEKLESQANISSLVKLRIEEKFNIRDRSPYEDLTILPNTSLLFKIPKVDLN